MVWANPVSPPAGGAEAEGSLGQDWGHTSKGALLPGKILSSGCQMPEQETGIPQFQESWSPSTLLPQARPRHTHEAWPRPKTGRGAQGHVSSRQVSSWK